MARFLLFTCMVMALVVPVTRSYANTYRVDNVAIEGRGTDLNVARESAIAQGTHTAFYQLLERLTGQVAESLPMLDGQAIDVMVKGYEVQSETITNQSYTAIISVQFHGPPIRQLLNEHQIGFSETDKQILLVLPVVYDRQGQRVRSAEEAWLERWQVESISHHVTTLRIYPADIDVLSLEVVQGLLGERDSVLDIPALFTALKAQHDDVVRILVPVMEVRTNATNHRHFVSVHTVYLYPERYTTERYETSGESLDKVMQQAVWKAAEYINEPHALAEAPKQSASQVVDTNIVKAKVAINGLQHWKTIRQALDATMCVEKTTVDTLAAQEVGVDLQITMSPQQCLDELKAAHFYVEVVGDRFWEVRY